MSVFVVAVFAFAFASPRVRSGAKTPPEAQTFAGSAAIPRSILPSLEPHAVALRSGEILRSARLSDPIAPSAIGTVVVYLPPGARLVDGSVGYDGPARGRFETTSVIVGKDGKVSVSARNVSSDPAQFVVTLRYLDATVRP